MTRRGFVVTALVLVLVTALAVAGLLLAGGVIGSRAGQDAASPVSGPSVVVALPELVVVPATAGGCPGEQFWAPALPVSAPVTPGDGSRVDASVQLGEGSALLVVCLGPVSERGDAAARTQHLVDEPLLDGTTTGPAAVQTPLGASMTYSNTFGEGRSLTEWHVDRDGWAFAVGALQGSAAIDAAGIVEQVIATWEWAPTG